MSKQSDKLAEAKKDVAAGKMRPADLTALIVESSWDDLNEAGLSGGAGR
jgi:hypothetical protein